MKYTNSKRKIRICRMIAVCVSHQFCFDGCCSGRYGDRYGRVVDLDGKPVAELPIFIAPLDDDGDGYMSPVFLPNEHAQLRRAHTDLEGRFSITGVPSGPMHIGALPYDIDTRLPKDFENIVEEFTSKDWTELTQDDVDAFVSSNFGLDPADFEPDVEVLSLRIQGFTLYPRNDYDEIAFGLKPGAYLKDVEVTVQPRMRVRGRVLSRTEPRLSIHASPSTPALVMWDNAGSSSGGADVRVDPDGYFILYIDEKNDAAFYTISAEYQIFLWRRVRFALTPGTDLMD